MEHFGSKYNDGSIDSLQIELPARWRLTADGGPEAADMAAAAVARATLNYLRAAYSVELRGCRR